MKKPMIVSMEEKIFLEYWKKHPIDVFKHVSPQNRKFAQKRQNLINTYIKSGMPPLTVKKSDLLDSDKTKGNPPSPGYVILWGPDGEGEGKILTFAQYRPLLATGNRHASMTFSTKKAAQNFLRRVQSIYSGPESPFGREAHRYDNELFRQQYKEAKSNPPAKLTPIYSHCIEIKACKAGLPHDCDARCKAAGHRYKHSFKGKSKSPIFGLPDGRLLIG